MGLISAIADRVVPARREHRAAVARLTEYAIGLEAEKRRLESVLVGDRLYLPWEYQFDGDRLIYPSGFPADRKGGRNWPVVQTEQDLRQIRAFSRVLCDTNVYAQGFLNHVTAFCGVGYSWECCLRGQAKGAVSTGLADRDGDGRPDVDPDVAACQQVLDEFRSRNGWGPADERHAADAGGDASPPPDREQEAFRRYCRDGEVFLHLDRGGVRANGVPWVRFLEPEQITTPPGHDLYSPYGWGIETDPEDVERRIAYHAVSRDRPQAWGREIPAANVVHLRANVDGTVKRGLPDFFPLQDLGASALTLLNAMSKVAGVQASVAYVRQHAPQVTGTQVQRLIDSTTVTDRKPAPAGYPTQAPDGFRQLTLHQAGAIIDIANQMQIQPPPASPGTPGFVQVQQQTLRAMGLKWGCPEYFTGDASNANFASTLVSGGPFERQAKLRQNEFKAGQMALATAVLRLAVESGRLTAGQVAKVAVRVTAPEVAIANKLEGTQRRQILHAAGVLSVQTWARQEGEDPAQEAANRKAWDAQFPDQAAAGGGLGGGLGGLFGESRRPRPGKRYRLRWLHESHGPPPRPGLVWDDASHRWARPEGGGADARTSDEEVPPALARGLKERFNDFAVKAAGALYKVDALFQKFGLPAVEAVFDTPSDLEKFGYAPLGTGPVAAAQQMGAGDPIRAQLGISAHLAASLISQGVAKAWVMAKKRRAKAEADAGDLEQLAAALSELFALAHEWLGLDLPAPTPAAVLARLKKTLAK